MDRDAEAWSQLGIMLDAVKREFFDMGEFRCRKKLANGAVVTIQIRMPARPLAGDTK